MLPDGTRRLTDQELAAIDRSARKIGILPENINPSVLRKIRRLFTEGKCNAEYWSMVVDEEYKPGIKSLAYFVSIIEADGEDYDPEQPRRKAHTGQALAGNDRLPTREERALNPDHPDHPARDFGTVVPLRELSALDCERWQKWALSKQELPAFAPRYGHLGEKAVANGKH